MLKDFTEFWNEYYKNNTYNNMYSIWIDGYLQYFNKNAKIIELGAGNGDLSIYLHNLGYDVTATDLSDVALENIKKKCNGIKIMKLDLQKDFEMKNTYDIVIADLSLHYFNFATTIKIVNQVYNSLKDSGLLIARVNSVDDRNNGAGQGKVLEKNYYEVQGYYKRFFDEKDIKTFFKIFNSLHYKKVSLNSGTPKQKEIYEIIAKKV